MHYFEVCADGQVAVSNSAV